jgi:hypothetical protein
MALRLLARGITSSMESAFASDAARCMASSAGERGCLPCEGEAASPAWERIESDQRDASAREPAMDAHAYVQAIQCQGHARSGCFDVANATAEHHLPRCSPQAARMRS